MRAHPTLARVLLTASLSAAPGFGAVQAVATPQAAGPDPACNQPGPTPLKLCECPDGTTGWCDSLGKCNCPER